MQSVGCMEAALRVLRQHSPGSELEPEVEGALKVSHQHSPAFISATCRSASPQNMHTPWTQWWGMLLIFLAPLA